MGLFYSFCFVILVACLGPTPIFSGGVSTITHDIRSVDRCREIRHFIYYVVNILFVGSRTPLTIIYHIGLISPPK
jgi:hypothetical protein